MWSEAAVEGEQTGGQGKRGSPAPPVPPVPAGSPGSHYPCPQGDYFNSFDTFRDFSPSQSGRCPESPAGFSAFSLFHFVLSGLFFWLISPRLSGEEEEEAAPCRGGRIFSASFAHHLGEKWAFYHPRAKRGSGL